MRHLYTAVLYLALPFIFLRLFFRGVKAPAYRERWLERLGRFDARANPEGIWIHAVSVGEVQAVQPLIKHLLDDYPAVSITVTTTTPTGSRRLRELFNHRVVHVYLPYDLPAAIHGFLERIQPQILLMVETEIWPNLLMACHQHGIKTLLANARLSQSSARSYGRFADFTRQTFGLIDCVAAQTDADARRFIALGVPEDHIRVTGSIKFDMRIPASISEQAQALRRGWGNDRPVWVAASTHEGEDEIVLAAHQEIRRHFPLALLILVARHPERFDQVFKLSRNLSLETMRRSTGAVPTADTAVYVGDTMGELPQFLGAADAAFIGGSLVPTGGHNSLEAAAQGLPVTFGPHTFNFQAISELMLERNAAVRVTGKDDLAQTMIDWLGDASTRTGIGENGRQVVKENRGALLHLTQILDEMFEAKHQAVN